VIEFSLSPRQKALQDMVRGFGRSIVRPQSLAWDREHKVPEDFLARFVEMASQMGGAGAAWGVIAVVPLQIDLVQPFRNY